MINWIKRLFHIHKWEDSIEPYTGHLSILPTQNCGICGLTRKYFGPAYGWKYRYGIREEK